MFIPKISKSTKLERRRLLKKKNTGRGSGSSSSTSDKESSNKGSSMICFSGQCKNATPYSDGGGPTTTIPPGQRFSGRSIGGGTREEIYGNRTYGSGYGTHCSSCHGPGVRGRPFPFYFWPIVWSGTSLVLFDSYLDSSSEYGGIDDSERPGGSLFVISLSSPSTNTIFRLISDNTTVNELVIDISTECQIELGNKTPLTPISLLDFSAQTSSNELAAPRPEQAVQYYRASSIVLTLDGYNNSATHAIVNNSQSDTNNSLLFPLEDSPLPQNIDLQLLTCLNETIGMAAPLIDSTTSSGCNRGFSDIVPSFYNLVSLVLSLWMLIYD